MSKLMGCKPPLNSLLPLHRGDYTYSVVVGITGPKRSGKSLLLAKLLWRDMIVGRIVWSNMTVKTPKFYLDKGYPLLQTKPIDWDGLYLLSEEYQEGTIGLDESIYYDDSRASLSMRNKLFNTIMNQVGHRNLNVYYTVKSQGWLDRRLQFETDLEIKCRDMGKTPWGRENHVRPGTFINLKAYDKSGSITGREFSQLHPKPFKVWWWSESDIYWTAYDTKEIIGLEELYTGVKLDLGKRVISNKPKINEAIMQSLYEVAEEFREQGDTVPCETFWNTVAFTGIPGASQQLGKHLKQLNVSKKAKRGGDIYDLSKLVAKVI